MTLRFFLGSVCASIILASCGKPADIKQPTNEAIASAPSTALSGTTISSGDLNGLWIDTGGNSPIVLIVPGSGPTDLDGNNPMGVSANSYKLLAEGLAAKGISTVRVDKRGMFTSEAAGDPNAVTLDIYAKDYRDWARTLTWETGRDCIYLLGHSEGGLMVSAAAIDNETVCGLILVAAPWSSLWRNFARAIKSKPRQCDSDEACPKSY